MENSNNKNLSLSTQEAQFKEDKIKGLKNSTNEQILINKSTDFNAKELDEKLDSPIDIRKLESNSFLASASVNSQTTYSSSQKEMAFPQMMADTAQIKHSIHLKIIYMTNLHYFLQNYINDIHSLFSKIDAIIYRKVTSILDKSKYFQRFFKEITTLYDTFSINLLQTNNTINLHFKEEEDDGPFCQVNSTVDKSQELISNSFYDFSKNLQSKLLVKGPLSNVKEYYNRMSNISKVSTLITADITRKRDKLVQKFQTHEKIFESFKKSFNDVDKLSNILNKTEFFLIEFEYCSSVNKLFKKIRQFFLKYKNCLTDLKSLSLDFIRSLKETVDIYVNESKKMFLIEEMDNVLDKIKLDVNHIDENSKDILMSLNSSKSLNVSLKNLQTNLLKFTFVKNEYIYNDELFNMDRYSTYEELNDFMIQILPQDLDVLNSSQVLFVCEVNKVYGLFKSYKKCVLLITLQNSILIFEEKINWKSYERFSMKNLKFRNCEDKKHPFRFELTEVKLGMIYNSTVKMTFDTQSDEIYNIIEGVLKNAK